jgi:hypothetical protein
MIRLTVGEAAGLYWLLSRIKEDAALWEQFGRIMRNPDELLVSLNGQIVHAQRMQEDGIYAGEHVELIDALAHVLSSPFAGASLVDIGVGELRKAILSGQEMESVKNKLRNRDFFCKCGHEMSSGEIGMFQAGSRFAEEGMDPKIMCLSCGLARFVKCRHCNSVVRLSNDLVETLRNHKCEAHQEKPAEEASEAASAAGGGAALGENAVIFNENDNFLIGRLNAAERGPDVVEIRGGVAGFARVGRGGAAPPPDPNGPFWRGLAGQRRGGR